MVKHFNCVSITEGDDAISFDTIPELFDTYEEAEKRAYELIAQEQEYYVEEVSIIVLIKKANEEDIELLDTTIKCSNFEIVETIS